MNETEEVALWALAEGSKLQLTDPMGSPLEDQVIQSWKANRPKMVARLAKYGAVNASSSVLVDRMLKSERTNTQAGLPPTDAREEAEKDWLMLEPEEEDGTTQAPYRPPVSSPTTDHSFSSCVVILFVQVLVHR